MEGKMGKRYQRKGQMRRSYLRTYSADYIGGANMKTPNAVMLAEYSARAGSGSTEVDRIAPKVLQHLKKVGDYYTVSIINGRYQKLDLFFGSSIFFLKEDVLSKAFHRSITYTSRSMAMDAWHEGRITWIEEFPGH